MDLLRDPSPFLLLARRDVADQRGALLLGSPQPMNELVALTAQILG